MTNTTPTYKFGISDLKRFNDFMKARDEFSFRTFGTPEERGPIYPLRHLAKEVQELLDNVDDPMEWADCFLLFLDAAWRNNLSVDDLVEFSRKKLEVNRGRVWIRREDGTFKHQEVVAHGIPQSEVYKLSRAVSNAEPALQESLKEPLDLRN